MFGTRFFGGPVAATTTVQEKTPQPGTLQNQGSFPHIREVVQQVKNTIEWTAEWSQSDSWTKTYGGKIKVVTSTERQPLVGTLKNETGESFDEVDPFFESYPLSRSVERQARVVKGFCGDTKRLLLPGVTSDGSDEIQPHKGQAASAWVSDRDWYPQDSEDTASVPHKSFGRVLGDNDIWAVLKKKRFSENDDEEIGPPRRIYIDKPDKNSILALLKTTPPSQVAGFRELLANYITDAPTPVMSSREIFWWGSMCFLFSFNLPFFATSTQTEKDNRMLWNGKIPLRRRHDLSFLHLEDHDKHRYSGTESSSSKNELFLVEGVCSIVVTGRTDRYWTAACLNDDLSEEDDEPRLTIEDEDDPDMDTEKDPIILKVYNKPVSPRAYALAALATSLTKIADYHKDIQHQFGTSLNHHTPTSWYGTPKNSSSQPMQDWRKRYPEVLEWVIHYNSRLIEKLEYFLSHHLMITPEGLPQHPLWQSVHKEERVIQCLTDLRDILDSLRDVDSELRRFLQTCVEARRERKFEYQDEQVGREKTLHKITFAGFALGILNLIAQIYAARPENASALSSPGFMALTWGSFGLCLIICLIPLWAAISQHLTRLGGYIYGISVHIIQVAREQLNCLKDFLALIRYLRVRRIGVILRRTILRLFQGGGRRASAFTSPV
ncbi:hypothetical protein DER46DRAFT_7575 [Fusarium sp. MPI-SDFR-AT-0072]|nr:hypothetical protein DER46DRAFT_7575 [Fusarium sp. MPI-SDFR-AT-0072]